jgi:hypothetical protein
VSKKKDPKACPECGGEIAREPYEDYLYCLDCGWDENIDLDAKVEEVGAEDEDDTLDLDDEIDPNLDPEAGESA